MTHKSVALATAKISKFEMLPLACSSLYTDGHSLLAVQDLLFRTHIRSWLEIDVQEVLEGVKVGPAQEMLKCVRNTGGLLHEDLLAMLCAWQSAAPTATAGPALSTATILQAAPARFAGQLFRTSMLPNTPTLRAAQRLRAWLLLKVSKRPIFKQSPWLVAGV